MINEKTGKAETEKLTYERADFWASTSNKQLNFVQHIANMLKIDDRATAKEPWTKQLWVYDYRTNVHKTLKQNRLVKSDFDEFVECFKPDDKSQRCESAEISRWKSFKYDELMPRDKTNLDIFWLKDDSLEDTENFPPPDVIAAEIVEHLEAALEEFRNVEDLLALSEASI